MSSRCTYLWHSQIGIRCSINQLSNSTQPDHYCIFLTFSHSIQRSKLNYTSFLFRFPLFFVPTFPFCYYFPVSTLPIQDYWYKPSSTKQNDSSAMLGIKDISRITPRQKDRTGVECGVYGVEWSMQTTTLASHPPPNPWCALHMHNSSVLELLCYIERKDLFMFAVLSNAWRFISHAFLPLTMYWGHSR